MGAEGGIGHREGKCHRGRIGACLVHGRELMAVARQTLILAVRESLRGKGQLQIGRIWALLALWGSHSWQDCWQYFGRS